MIVGCVQTDKWSLGTPSLGSLSGTQRKARIGIFLQGLLLPIANRYDLAFSPRSPLIPTIHDDLIRSVALGVRTLSADVEIVSPILSEPLPLRLSSFTMSTAMSNLISSSVSRRDVLLTAVLASLWGTAGCGESGGDQTVTTPPKATGTRGKLDKYKETVEDAAKKSRRKS